MKFQLTNTLYYSLSSYTLTNFRSLWDNPGIVKFRRRLWEEEGSTILEYINRGLKAFEDQEASTPDWVAIARKFFDDNPTVDLVKSMRKATLKDFGDHPYIPSHKLDVGPVKPTGPRFAQTQETSLGNTPGYYLSPSYGLIFDLVKPTQKVTLNHFGYHPYIPSHKLDVGPVKPTSPRFAQTQETFLGDTAGYYLSPSYGIDGGLVEHTSLRFAQTQEGSLGNTADYYPSSSYGLDVDQVNLTGKDIGNYFTDHRLIPSHELDISAVKPVTDAFTWIQEIISNTIWDYHSVPSYELHGGLVKTITKVIAWIKGGIDAFDNIVSLFHWYVARPAPVFWLVERNIDFSSFKKDYSANDSLFGRGYKRGSAVVGEKAIVSGNHVSFFIDPNDTVLSKLLAAIDIGKDLFNKSIDNCFDVKTKSHGGLSPIFL